MTMGAIGIWCRAHWATVVSMAVMAIVVTAAYLWADAVRIQSVEDRARAAAASTVASFASSVGNSVNKRLALVRGLAVYAAVVAQTDDLSHFRDYADALRTSISGIRNISLAPDFVIRLVNPVRGNERVVGNDLLTDPRPGFAETVQRAIETRGVTTHGPLPLIQGGMGLIARHAVFFGLEPWGAVGVVFDLDPILDEARLAALAPKYSYVLKRADGAFIAGDPATLVLDPIVERIEIPDGDWELAVVPVMGWRADDGSGTLFLAAFVVLGLLLEVVVLLVAERRIALSRQVAERTHELARRTAELQETKSELEQFAYAAAHDLQEPVRTMGSYAQLLERGLGDRLNAEEREFIGHVVEGAAHLRTLLRDIQLFAAEDRVPLPQTSMPADRALDAALKALGAKIAKAGATVVRDRLPVVMADERRLKEIFLALVGNAVEYRHPDRIPEVHIGARRKGRFDLLTVHDNGVGIEERHCDQIFKVFRRLHRRENHPGTGMGLAIARKMARRLGGDISVASEPGVGSVFTVRLPAADQGVEP